MSLSVKGPSTKAEGPLQLLTRRQLPSSIVVVKTS
jgi:hypothetical protein